MDNLFLEPVTDEWGTWDNYQHQSRLYVSGLLNLNSGELSLTNVAMNVDGSAVVNQNGAEVTVTNQAVPAEQRRTTGNESNDWIASAHVEESAVLNINGGSFEMTNKDVDGGMNVRGTLNMRNGTLNVSAPDGIAIAARGQNTVSGGTMTLSGYVGYEQAYEEGFEQGKLTVTGGNINIKAVNTGLDLYNDLVVTGGTIDIDVSGYINSFTDDKGVPITLLAGCGIMGYNDHEKISISINGGTLNVKAPVNVPAECNAVSVFGILGGRNATVRINGGDVGIQARTALYAESQETGNHVVINSRMQVLSINSGNVLDISSGIVEFTNEGKKYTWYVDTFEEDENWTTPYENAMMADYATNLRIVRKSAGTNANWDLQDGTLTISAPSGTVGAMAKTADWNLVADKITKVVIDPSITSVDTEALDLMTNLKAIKVPHGSAAETYAKGITLEYFHQPQGDRQCVVDNCALAIFTSIVESDTEISEKVKEVQKIDNEALKQELENSSTSAEQFEELEKAAEIDVQVAVESTDDQNVPKELDVGSASVVGAKMNAEEDTQKVALVIGAPATVKEFDTTEYEKVVSFSMELTTTDTENQEETVEELKTPVQITLPLPSGMDVSRLEILHYHDDGTVEKVNFTHVTVESETGDQTFVSFWVTKFSDFDIRTKAQKLQVVVNNLSVTYGDTVPSLTNVYKVLDEAGNVAALPEDVTVTVNTPAVTKAGTYTITAEVNKNGVNCDITVVPGVLTVAKQQYTIVVKDQNMIFGGEQPDLTDAFQVLGKDGKEAALPTGVTVTVKMPEFTKAGEYPITAAVASYDNYAFTVKDGKLTVSKQPITITMDPQSMKIGEAQPELTYTVTLDGKVLTAGEIAACGLDITPKIEQFTANKAGVYTITAYVAENDKYEVAVVNADMAVIDTQIQIFKDTVNHSVLYKDKIQIQYHFNLADTSVEVTKYGALIWTAAEYEAELEAFTAAKACKTLYTSDSVYHVELVKQNGRYRADNEGQKPRELHVEYYAVPYAIVDGEYWYGNADLYSVQQYADDILTKSTNEASRKTVEAMMRFAKYTQIYLEDADHIGVFEDVLSKHNLATNVEWTAEDESLLHEQIVVTQPEYSTDFIAWAGTSLLMKDQTGLCFVLDGKFTDEIEVLYWNASDYEANSASPIKGTETGVLEKIEYSKSRDQALKTGISARLSDEVYYVRMYNTSTGAYSEVKADSVATNLTRMVNKYTGGSNNKALYFAAAYLKYAATAKAYLG